MPHVRCSKCGGRRTLARKPEEYVRLPRCARCGRKMHVDPADPAMPHYRVDKYRATRERGRRAPKPCTPGHGGCYAYSFPHRRGSGYCIHNPTLTDDDMRERQETGSWA